MTEFPWSDYKPTHTDPAAEYEAARREFDERRYVPATERLEWTLEQAGRPSARPGRRPRAAGPLLLPLRAVEACGGGRASSWRTDPTHAYAALLLGRVLQSGRRADAAKAPLALAAALGRELEKLDAVEIQGVATTTAAPDAE